MPGTDPYRNARDDQRADHPQPEVVDLGALIDNGTINLEEPSSRHNPQPAAEKAASKPAPKKSAEPTDPK